MAPSSTQTARKATAETPTATVAKRCLSLTANTMLSTTVSTDTNAHAAAAANIYPLITGNDHEPVSPCQHKQGVENFSKNPLQLGCGTNNDRV